MSIHNITDVNGNNYYQYDDYGGDGYYYYITDYTSATHCFYKEPAKWAYEYYEGNIRTRAGLPVNLNNNEETRPYVIGTQLLVATLAVVLNSLCLYVVFRKKNLGKSVRFIILLDTFGRLVEGLTFYYKGSCEINWHCVEMTGFISPILLNRIVTAIGNGVIVSMLLLLHCLSINRVFAVFFRGKYYEPVQYISFPYSIFCFLLPIIFQSLNIRDLPNPKSDGVCYAGLFYDPSKFMAHGAYYAAPYQCFYQFHIAYFLGGFLVVPLILDVITVIWVRQISKQSEAKRRADLRLSIMMLINCLIWVQDIVMHYYLFLAIPGVFGYFFTYDAWPTLGHCFLCVITILFNLPPRAGRDRKTSRVVTVTTTA